MNFVIPMAGKGQRFVDAGYKVPKMLIEAKGKTLLQWSIDSLPMQLCTNLVCIILQEHEEQFRLSSLINELYAEQTKVQFLFLDKVTRGQAETIFLAKDLLDTNIDLVVFNIDTYFKSDGLAEKLQINSIDGVLGAFDSAEDRFSFAQTDELGIVVKTAEKQVISNNALTGMYHFKKVADFIDTVSYHLDNDIRVNNEFYIAPMYNYLIAKGKKFIVDHCDEHAILGTPQELEQFLHST